jgi:titin
MSNLVLIDSRVYGVDDIISSLTPDTDFMIYDFCLDTYEMIQSRIQKPYTSVVIAQHNYGLPRYNMIMSTEPACVKDVATADPELETWAELIAFFQWLKQNGANCVDFLACDLWANKDWVYVIEKLRSRLELTIRASIDITGPDGNFVLESDNVDTIGIYFTSNILKYKYNFYTSAVPNSLSHGPVNYSPLIFTAANPGYISATAYKAILGTTAAYTNGAYPTVQLTSDISNVAMVCMTDAAVAVLKTNGTVVAFGGIFWGGDASPVASQLYNITKIVSTQSWFSALRSDGKVISWGDGFQGKDINSWVNNAYSDYVLISDVSNSLVNIVDLYANSAGVYALNSSGRLIGFGRRHFSASYPQIESGVVKMVTNGQWMVVIKNNGTAGWLPGGYISMSSTANPNPIIDAFVCDVLSIYIRSTPTNTKQVTNLGGLVYYTIPVGVSVIRYEMKEQNGVLVLLSNNVLLSIVGNACTVINNVTDFASNTYSWCYLQNNVVVANGSNPGYPYGSSLTHPGLGIPAGSSLTNVRRLISTESAVGALKFDNTFVWWGAVYEPYARSFSSVAMPRDASGLYTAISSDIASVYACYQGFVFSKTNGNLVSFGTTSWGAGTLATANYGAKRPGKNVGFVPNLVGFIAVDTTPATSFSMSQYMQYAPTTVTYYNNNPDVMAIRGRKYSVMVGDIVIGTWICPADTFTFTFTNVVFVQNGPVTASIYDTPNLTTSKAFVGSFDTTITTNPGVSQPDPPTINSVTIGTQQLTVSFSAPAWNGGAAIIGYKYSIDGGATYTTLPATSTQFVATGLTGSSYTIRMMTTSYVGDSYYVEYNALLYNPPSAPTVSSVVPGNQQAVITVSTSNNGGGAITGYKYAFSASGPFTSFAVSPTGGTTGATTYTMTGLLNGTTYSVYVKSTNGAGDSPATTYGPFTLGKTAPQVPVITSVVAGNGSMTVNFTAPYNGGDALTGYKYILNNSVVDASAVTIGAVSNSFVISGLTNGTTYTVKMSAMNTMGTSAYSTVSSSVVPKTVPSAPAVTSVTPGNQQVVVEYTVSESNGGAEITQYKYRLNGGSAVALDGSGSSPFTISGLTNGTSYTLTMTAINAAGESAPSASSSAFIPSTVPSTPLIQSITASNQSISVVFTADNGGSPLTSLEYSLNDASNVSIQPTYSPLVISGLTNGTAYRVQIRVSNANGSTDMSEYSAYATPVTIPTAPSITGIQSGDEFIEFSFSSPLDDGSSAITGYKYALNGGAFSAIGLIQSPYRITNGIQNGTSYSVQLKATNSVGDSPASTASDSVVPCKLPDAPRILSVQNGDKQATLQLSAGNNGGSAILSYTYSVNDAEPVVISSVSSPIVFTNLEVGVVYSFQIKATNIVGDSVFATTTFTGMSTPDEPVIIGASAGNKSIIVEFTTPNANSSPITGYKYSIQDGVYLPATLLDATHISISGLSENVEYTVKLVAINAIGQSADSYSSSATPYTFPLAPTIGTITVDNGTASVEFTAQSDNGTIITEYAYSLNNGNYIEYPSVESPLVLSGLSNGVAYTIKMKARNAAGLSLVASSASFMPRTIPEAPVITSVTSGNQLCEVGFTPGFFNGAIITKYRYSLNGVDFQDATGTMSPITIDGLVNGTTYMVYLLAVNAVGESTISAPSSAFVPFVTQSTPNPPTDLSVIAGNESVTVHFTDGINLGSAIKGYMYSIDGGATRWWAKQSSSPLIIDGLENGVEQSIQIRAVNNSGPSEWSDPSELFTPCASPDAPILTGVEGADESIIVSFLPGSSNGAEISSYEYSIDGGVSYLSLGLDSTIYGLTNGTSYNVTLRAMNSVGASSPSVSSASVIPHKAPSPPTITSVLPGDNSLTVAFTPGNTNGSEVSYYEYAFETNNGVGAFSLASSKQSPIVISGLENGVGYRVVLRAVSCHGLSSESSTTSNEVLPGTVPSTPIITKLLPENGAIQVNWTANANGSAITEVTYSLNDGPYVNAGTTDASFSITSLLNGTPYSISIIATNAHGSSAHSVVSEAIIPLAKPEPPSVTSIVPGDGKAELVLVPGSSNGSSVLGYQYSLDGTSYKWVKDTASPITIYGLDNGSNYTVYLKTFGESVGESVDTTISSVMPYRSPDAPIIQSISVGNGSAVVTFVDGNANGLTITGYKYSLDGVNYIDISGVNNTITLTGLTNGESYTVRLKSVSSVALSAPSVVSAPFTPYTDPSPPTITKIVTGNQTASIFIQDGSANGSGETLAYKYTFDNITYYWASSSTSPIVISSGLVNNQGYKIRVATKTALGMSAYCAQSTTFVPYTLPGAPTISSVVPGNGLALIYFTDGNTNGRPITKYQYALNGVSYPEVTGTSPLLINGLTNGTPYTVTMTNYNLAGYSIPSIASSVFTPYSLPGAPTITNLVPLANQITVYISPGNTNGSAIKSYAYSLNGGGFTNVPSAALSFVIPGLTNGTSYTVAVKAFNDAGDGNASATSAAVVPFTVPDPPTITGVTVGNKSATVYITNGNNNGRNATQYQYTYTSSEGSTTLTTSTSTTQLSSFVITGLTNWVSYRITVRAINAAGSSLPSGQSNEVVPFLVPTSATIGEIIQGDSQLTVVMSGYSPDAGIIGYKYSLDNGPLTFVASTTASFTITGLVNGQYYTVRVKSSTSAGDSPFSTASSPIHPRSVPNAPTNVVVTPLNESASVTFTDGSGNGEPVQYYMYSINGDVDTPIKKRTDGTLKIFGISNSVNYSVRLRAVNIVGVSPYSAVSNIFMPYSLPLVPPVVTKILPGNGCAYVYFSEADTNGSVLTKFKWTNGTTKVDISGITSPLTIPGLVNKKPVTISIASCNIVGESPYTTAVSIIPGVPLAPVITDVVASPTRLTVYFDVPENNGFPITSYSYGFPGAKAYIKAASASTTSASPLILINLKNGTPYDITIIATNANGNSEISNSIGPRTPCAPPTKVAITGVTPLLDGGLAAFAPPANNGAPITGYKYALNGSTTFIDASGVALPLRIYGTTPNTMNTVKVIATNPAGDSLESAVSKPFSYVFLPPAQVKVTALTIALNQLTVAFLPPLINGSPITGYQYALNDSTTFTDVSGVSLPLVIRDGILPNTSYNVRIVAVNAAGSSVPSLPVAKPVAFVYLPPLAPTITTIISGNQSAIVTFAGQPARGVPITGYAYTLDASAEIVYDVSGAVSPMTITGLTNDTLYNVRIAAITSIGYSAWSAVKTVTPVYKVPDMPLITGVTAGSGQLTVAFTAPAANGSPIIGYKYSLNGVDKVEIETIIGGKSFVITGLTAGTVYNVRMCATNILGDSALSLPKSGTPKP